MASEYIYLLQEREFIKCTEPIYKIGKTKQENLKRLCHYPKGSKLIIQVVCTDCDTLEKQLISLFTQKYELQKHIGNEYFKGNYIEMRRDIFKHIDEAQCVVEEEMQEIEKTGNVDENDNKAVYVCKKCRTTYKTLKCFQKHIGECNGIGSLTCPTCMKTFNSSGNKCRHIKQNSCKPVTIFTHIKNQFEKECLSNVNRYRIADLCINNYGRERNDYITYNVFCNIVKDPSLKIISEYFRVKHYHKEFPENYNIVHKNRQFLIKQDGKWNIINKHSLRDMIYNDCGREVTLLREKYKERLESEPDMTKEKIKEIDEMSDYLQLEQSGKDAQVKHNIINVIENASKKYSPEYVLNTNGCYGQTT